MKKKTKKKKKTSRPYDNTNYMKHETIVICCNPQKLRYFKNRQIQQILKIAGRPIFRKIRGYCKKWDQFKKKSLRETTKN